MIVAVTPFSIIALLPPVLESFTLNKSSGSTVKLTDTNPEQFGSVIDTLIPVPEELKPQVLLLYISAVTVSPFKFSSLILKTNPVILTVSGMITLLLGKAFESTPNPKKLSLGIALSEDKKI
jgi:hypothetical protein